MKHRLKEVIENLRKEAQIARQNANDFSKRHFNGEAEHALICCLRRAADITDGFVLAAETSLIESANILERSLFETLVVTRWLMQSDENVQMFNNAGINEMKRLARKNLLSGYAKILNKKNQEDKTSDFIQSSVMKEIPKRLRIEEMAKNANFERIYTMYYGFQSLLVHGTSSGIKSVKEADELLYMAASAAGGFIYAINVTIQNWIFHRKQTPMSDINRILGV
ncbi:MAG: DUF5677 domain-containing protein [Dissulfurispiraceae bacterium]